MRSRTVISRAPSGLTTVKSAFRRRYVLIGSSSDSTPCSTNCIAAVAVYVFVIEPAAKTDCAVIRVLRLSVA